MSHPLRNAAESVSGMKREAVLLGANDTVQDRGFLLGLALNEFHKEFLVELMKYGTPEYSHLKLWDELNDVWVFIQSWLNVYSKDPVLDPPLYSVNGQGNRSNSLERFPELVMTLPDDPNVALELAKHFLSIAKHLPHPNIGLVTFPETIGKVLRNRDPNLYSTYCPVLSRELEGSDINSKYRHLEKMTRILRDTVDRKLLVTDWVNYYMMMVDWRHSDFYQYVLGACMTDSAFSEEIHKIVARNGGSNGEKIAKSNQYYFDKLFDDLVNFVFHYE